MHEQLQREDEELFARNGVLAMLERDIATKDGPERWQSLSSKQLRQIDVVVCLDYQMYLVVLNGACIVQASDSLSLSMVSAQERLTDAGRSEHAHSLEPQEETPAPNLPGRRRHPGRRTQWQSVRARALQSPGRSSGGRRSRPQRRVCERDHCGL